MAGLIALVALAFAALAGMMSVAAPVAAAVCPRVFVPEGYVTRCLQPSEHDWQLEVLPEAPVPGGLSRMTVRPVDDPVDDPVSWLQQQLTVDLTTMRLAFRDAFDRPDNPLRDFVDPDWLSDWLAAFDLLGQLPLRGCAFPFEHETGGTWQIDCHWDFGLATQYARMQLIDFDGSPHLVTIWTHSPRRLRHLQAIANSLEWQA